MRGVNSYPPIKSNDSGNLTVSNALHPLKVPSLTVRNKSGKSTSLRLVHPANEYGPRYERKDGKTMLVKLMQPCTNPEPSYVLLFLSSLTDCSLDKRLGARSSTCNLSNTLHRVLDIVCSTCSPCPPIETTLSGISKLPSETQSLNVPAPISRNPKLSETLSSALHPSNTPIALLTPKTAHSEFVAEIVDKYTFCSFLSKRVELR